MAKHTIYVHEGPELAAAVPANGEFVGDASRMFGFSVSAARFDEHERVLVATDARDGRLVKMDLGIADVHVNTITPNYAAGYVNADGYADKVAAPVVMPKSSNKFPTWDATNVMQEADDMLAAVRGQVNEVTMSLSKTDYNCTPYGLMTFLPPELQANADGALNVKLALMSTLMGKHVIGRERRVVNLATDLTKWAASQKIAMTAATKWNGGVSSDPLANIDQLTENSLQPVTSMLMNKRVFNTFRRNAQVQKFIQFKSGVEALPSEQTINRTQALMNLPSNIYVSQMKVITALSPLAFDYIWPDVAILFREVVGAPTSQNDVSTFKTFRWVGSEGAPKDTITMASDGAMMLNGWVVREFYDPKASVRGGTATVVGVNDAECLTAVTNNGTTAVVGGILSGLIQ